jgi:DNA-binding transcriptional LysR family regulator
VLDLRDLECLVALARHRHFARAAEDCGLSQPAFSMRIRHLEERLDTSIVMRGNRFHGLTLGGEAIVASARRVLDEVKRLEQEVRQARGELVGQLSLGVVPTAAAYAGQAVTALQRDHPGIRVKILTASSFAIQQGVDDGRFDAGVTYDEGVSTDLLRVEPLYDERYVLLAPQAMVSETAESITWAEAAVLPLALLEPGMQNRRILDKVFKDAGLEPRVIAETNGLTAAAVMVEEGVAATVAPEVYVARLGNLPGTRALRLVSPDVVKSMSLVSPLRAQGLPILDAFRASVLLPMR